MKIDENELTLESPEEGITSEIRFKCNTTTYALTYRDGKDEFTVVGKSKCMKGDKFSKDIGSAIAGARALRNLADKLEEIWVARSVTQKDWEAKHTARA